MFLPFGDTQQRDSTPYVTRALLVINVLVFLYMLTLNQGGNTAVLIVDSDASLGGVQGDAGDAIGYPSSPLSDFTLRFGAVPEFIVGYLNDDNTSHDQVEAVRFNSRTGQPVGDGISLLDGIFLLLTPLTAMFLHGGWFHLIGNMLFLWVFGDNVEDRIGSWRFGLFYVLGGYAAAAAHIWIDSGDLLPMVGASGAIAAVLGAYLLLFPRSMVRILIFIGLLIPALVPAPILIVLFFITNLISGVGSLGVDTVGSGGTAWWAHLGGLLAGMILIYPFLIGRGRAPRQEVGPTWSLPLGVSGRWKPPGLRDRRGLFNRNSSDSSVVVDIRSRPVRSPPPARSRWPIPQVKRRLARRLRWKKAGGVDPYRRFDDH